MTTVSPWTWLKLSIVLVALFVASRSDISVGLHDLFDFRFLKAAIAVQPFVLLALIIQSKRQVILIGKPFVAMIFAVKAVTLANGLNVILPGRLAELLKATYLKDHAGVRISTGLSAVVLERTIDILIVAALGFVSFALTVVQLDLRVVMAFGAVGLTILFVALIGQSMVRRFASALPWRRPAVFIMQMYEHFASTVRSTNFLQAVAFSIITWMFSFLTVFVFLNIAGGKTVGLSDALLVLVFTAIGAAVPILPGGLGTYEIAGVLALRYLGFELNDAILMTLTLHMVQVLPILLCALMITFTEKVGILSLFTTLRKAIK